MKHGIYHTLNPLHRIIKCFGRGREFLESSWSRVGPSFNSTTTKRKINLQPSDGCEFWLFCTNLKHFFREHLTQSTNRVTVDIANNITTVRFSVEFELWSPISFHRVTYVQKDIYGLFPRLILPLCNWLALFCPAWGLIRTERSDGISSHFGPVQNCL